MKCTYLVFKNADSNSKELVVATQSEWDAILKANKNLPREERRFFTEDKIIEGNEIDCLYIEVTREEYDKWHSQHESTKQKTAKEKDFIKVGLDEPCSEDPEYLTHEVIADDYDLENTVISDLMMSALREALARWRAWGTEMLDYYLTGQKYSCTKILIEKYGISYKTVAERKSSFEAFLRKFFKKWG